ncbi:MAG TPA: hypothetical protein VGL63_07345 [Streptosporangiaceae bacterium]
MHPVLMETLIAQRNKDIRDRAIADENARLVRQARRARRQRSLSARPQTRSVRALGALNRINWSHPRPAR